MRLPFFLPLVLVLPVLFACSAGGLGFQPADCQSLSSDNSGYLDRYLYRDLMRGTYGPDDCFVFHGEVSQSIGGGYVVDTEGFGTGFPGDVFVRWEGDYRFVEGDLVIVTGAVAEPLTFETAIGSQRTIPAFHGSEIVDYLQRSKQQAATRQVIAATLQVEHEADYEQRTADALQEIQSCSDHVIEYLTSHIQVSYYYSDYRIDDLDPIFSIGPAPDDIDADTVPHILLEGSFTATLVRGENLVKGQLFILDGQVTAVWTGEDCEFTDILTDSSSGRTVVPPPPTAPIPATTRPDRDPKVPQPTYTPRPAPGG